MANNRLLREMEQKVLDHERKFKRDRAEREAEQPSFSTFQRNRLDDEITRAAAEKLLGHTPATAPVLTVEPTTEPAPAGMTLIEGDFSAAVAQYLIESKKEQTHLDTDEYVFALQLGDSGKWFTFELEDCKVPAGSQVPADVYELTVERTNSNLGYWMTLAVPSGHVRIEGDRCDVTKLTPLSDAQIEAAWAVLEPEPKREPAPPAFRRTVRQPGDSTSRLGPHDRATRCRRQADC